MAWDAETRYEYIGVEGKRHKVYTFRKTVSANALVSEDVYFGEEAGLLLVRLSAVYGVANITNQPAFAIWEQIGNTKYSLLSGALTLDPTSNVYTDTSGFLFTTPNRLFYSGRPLVVGLKNNNSANSVTFYVTLVVVT